MNNPSAADKREVQVHVVTDIRDGQRKETNSFKANGHLHEKDGVVYLTYEEKLEDGNVSTIVKAKPDEVIIMRSGLFKMRQVFRKQEQVEGSYASPYGPLQMSTLTYNIENKKMNTKGRLFLSYDLYLQGEKAGRYALTITFKEEQHS
ncbi:DUF1934 domain-containing protein [Priestia koreensis]|uniref:DUF1934 domain-containing protein n=1 Tax=Priestia koreensis TaxID=284581 RepID=UPI001F573D0C|nr:DUF1934 domain-containing protein [Priestia koreensis]MCM3006607.1 DUF1934 domain-containing protein [Priestia koreensis]UNL84910.1 DUF1934 domain-containing protein [Priestia koreensis]